jgi:hypothetical protein
MGEINMFEEKDYMGLDDNLWVTVRAGGGGGYGVTVRVWNENGYNGGDWVRGFQSLVFADSYYDSVIDGLCGSGFDHDVAVGIVESWGIKQPLEDYA